MLVCGAVWLACIHNLCMFGFCLSFGRLSEADEARAAVAPARGGAEAAAQRSASDVPGEGAPLFASVQSPGCWGPASRSAVGGLRPWVLAGPVLTGKNIFPVHFCGQSAQLAHMCLVSRMLWGELQGAFALLVSPTQRGAHISIPKYVTHFTLRNSSTATCCQSHGNC